MVLLDTLVHELNTIRGVLGEPDRIEYVSLHPDTVTVMFRFGELPVALHWIDLPGISRYEMEFACTPRIAGSAWCSLPRSFATSPPCWRSRVVTCLGQVLAHRGGRLP